MKLMISTAVIALAAISAPAAAQMYGPQPPSPPQQVPQPEQQSQPEAAQQQAGGIKPSKHALKALIDLQNAVKAKDTANIPAKVAAAQAAAQTKEDRYLIAQFQLKTAVDTNDNAAAAAAVDAIAATGVDDQAKTAKLYKGIGELFYQAKQYDKAAAAFSRSAVINPQDYDTLDLIGESYVGAGQKEQAALAFQHSIQVRSAAGQKAQELVYKKAVQLAYDAHAPNATEIALEWTAAYPSASSWSNAVAIYRNLNHPDTEGTVDLYRLMALTGSLTGPQWAQYSRAAADQGNYNEAQAAYDAGVAAKLINPTSPDYSDLTTGLKSKPKATAADLAAATKAAVSGMALLRIGDRYYAMGDYAKAVELYKMATGKPGVDPAVADLHVGMALTRSGDKAGATAAFNAVTGPRADIAKFWLLYVQKHA